MDIYSFGTGSVPVLCRYNDEWSPKVPSKHTHRSEIVDGERLRQLRNERRMSNTALATEAHLSTSMLERALAGKRPVGLSSIDRLANYFGLPPQELVKKEDVAEITTSISENSQWPLSLRRVETGADLCQFVWALLPFKQLDLYTASIASELDDDTGELVATLVEYVDAHAEENHQAAWAIQIFSENQADKIRRAAQFNKHVKELRELHIAIFAGTYLYQSVKQQPVYWETNPAGISTASGQVWGPITEKRKVIYFDNSKNIQKYLNIVVDRGLTDEQNQIVLSNCPIGESDPVGWFRREVAKETPVWTVVPIPDGRRELFEDDEPLEDA